MVCPATFVTPFPVVTNQYVHLSIGCGEDDVVYELWLFGAQVLVVGATRAGRGSVIWSVTRVNAASAVGR